MCRKPPKPYYNKVVLSLLKLQHTQDKQAVDQEAQISSFSNKTNE